MKANILIILTSASLLLCGCDFARSRLGMPTSAELEAKKAAILSEEAARKAEADSAAKALKMLQDSASVKKADPDRNYAYYVVVGVFEEKKNAERISRQISDVTGTPILRAWGGMTMVAAGGADTLPEATEILEKTRPSVPDAWIYKSPRR